MCVPRWDRRGVDLRKARICECGALLPRPVGGRHVAAGRIGRQIVHIAVATRRKNHGMGSMDTHASGDEIANHDAPSLPVDHDKIEHLGTRAHRDLSALNLPTECRIGAQEKLLSGLPTTVERTRDLDTPEGPVRQLPSILPRKRDAERHTLIDDLCTHLGESVHIGLARAEVSTFDRVIKQSAHAVSIVLVILGRVDSSLRRNAVGAARTVLKTKAFNLIAELSQGRGRAGSRKAGADDDDRDFSFVVWTYQLFAEPVPVPFGFQRAGRNSWIKFHHPRTIPKKMARMMAALPRTTNSATVGPAALNSLLNAACSSPNVCKLLVTAWFRCKPSPS